MSGCTLCFRTGTVLANRSTDHEGATPYAFRCECDQGKRRNKAYPRWVLAEQSAFTVLQQQVYSETFDPKQWNNRTKPGLVLVKKRDVEL